MDESAVMIADPNYSIIKKYVLLSTTNVNIGTDRRNRANFIECCNVSKIKLKNV